MDLVEKVSFDCSVLYAAACMRVCLCSCLCAHAHLHMHVHILILCTYYNCVTIWGVWNFLLVNRSTLCMQT